MRTGIILLVFVAASFSMAFAEQRSRERCQSMAEERGLHGGTGKALNQRRVFISNCMKGNLKKDRKQASR